MFPRKKHPLGGDVDKLSDDNGRRVAKFTDRKVPQTLRDSLENIRARIPLLPGRRPGAPSAGTNPTTAAPRSMPSVPEDTPRSPHNPTASAVACGDPDSAPDSRKKPRVRFSSMASFGPDSVILVPAPTFSKADANAAVAALPSICLDTGSSPGANRDAPAGMVGGVGGEGEGEAACTNHANYSTTSVSNSSAVAPPKPAICKKQKAALVVVLPAKKAPTPPTLTETALASFTNQSTPPTSSRTPTSPPTDWAQLRQSIAHEKASNQQRLQDLRKRRSPDAEGGPGGEAERCCVSLPSLGVGAGVGVWGGGGHGGNASEYSPSLSFR